MSLTSLVNIILKLIKTMKSIFCIHSTMGTAIINYIVIFLMIGNSFVMPEDSFDNRPLRTQNINLQVKSFATGFEIPWNGFPSRYFNVGNRFVRSFIPRIPEWKERQNKRFTGCIL